MAEYDTIAKYLIQTYPKDFIHFTLGHDNVEVIDILDTEQPTIETRHIDSLIRVRIDNEDSYTPSFKPQTAPTCPCHAAWRGISDEQLSITAYRSIPV